MIIKNKYFSIQQIADSGQCFRMKQLSENHYSLVAYERYLELIQRDEDTIELSCSEEEYKQIWEDYFDLEYDYDAIIHKLTTGDDKFLMEAAGYGKGIRILRQEPFEMLISFIISQNKNIPSIKQCINRICEKYGKPVPASNCKEIYYSFPTPEELAKAEKDDLRSMKLGYRDDYIISAAKAVADGDLILSDLKHCKQEEAVSALKKIHGVGDKVANCICLYGLHHIEAFPVDVWIKKVLKEIYHNNFQPEKYHGYAGIVQQYMFYYIRNRKTN